MLPHSARDRTEWLSDPLPSPVCATYPPSSGWCPLPRHSPVPFGVVGTHKSFPDHFSGEIQLRTASLPAWPSLSLPVPRRPETPTVFLFEVISQLIHGLGFLSARQAALVPGAGRTWFSFPRQDWKSS